MPLRAVAWPALHVGVTPRGPLRAQGTLGRLSPNVEQNHRLTVEASSALADPTRTPMTVHPDILAQWQMLARELRDHLEWAERGDLTTPSGSPYDAEEGISRLRTRISMFDDIIAAHGGPDS